MRFRGQAASDELEAEATFNHDETSTLKTTCGEARSSTRQFMSCLFYIFEFSFQIRASVKKGWPVMFHWKSSLVE
jgi:hypothetical protein